MCIQFGNFQQIYRGYLSKENFLLNYGKRAREIKIEHPLKSWNKTSIQILRNERKITLLN